MNRESHQERLPKNHLADRMVNDHRLCERFTRCERKGLGVLGTSRILGLYLFLYLFGFSPSAIPDFFAVPDFFSVLNPFSNPGMLAAKTSLNFHDLDPALRPQRCQTEHWDIEENHHHLYQSRDFARGQCLAQEYPTVEKRVSEGVTQQRFPDGPHRVTETQNPLQANTEPTYSAYAQVAELREDSTLRAVAFGTPDDGLACGDRGVILRTEDGGKHWQLVDRRSHCTFTDIAWMSPRHAIIVGGSIDRVTGISRGLVLSTNDAGLHWVEADDAELPMLRKIQRDGSKLKAVGDWSNSLLTHHFESTDNGSTWHAADETTSQLPESKTLRSDQLRWRVATNHLITVRDACRTSEKGRCLVGDHGVIALTNDQGQTWDIVRGSQRKTAVLFISQSPQTVAWSLVGSEALEERHRVSILCQSFSANHLGQYDSDEHLQRLQAARQAAINCGAASIDEMESGSTIDISTVAKQWIAIQEPSVLVLDQTLPANVKEAFVTAGISRKIKRVIEYSFCDPESSGRQGTLMHRNALLSNTGVLAGDFYNDAMHWIAPHAAQCQSVQMVTLYDIATASARGESLMNGISIKNSERLQAKAPNTSRRKLQIARARLQQDSQAEQLVNRTVTIEQFRRLFNHLIGSTSKEDQFRLVWEILARTRESLSDHPSLAKYEAALEICRDRFPERSVSDWAKLRLESIQNSNEWRKLRALLPNQIQKSKHPFGGSEIVVSPFQKNADKIQQASAISPANPSLPPVVVPKLETATETHTQRAAKNGKVDLNWEFHPVVLLSREASRLRNDHDALQVANKISPDVVRLSQSTNRWSEMLKTNGKRSLRVKSTIQAPHLDGRLNETCWNRPIKLQDGTSIQVSHDEEYVYFGVTVSSKRMKTDPVEIETAQSLRDESLELFDRLKICIDTDRDLLTRMELQVTATGRVHDAIDGCKNWQPTWYPAILSNGESITYEIAILRRDLTELPIAPSEKWFLAVSPVSGGLKNQTHMIPQPENWMQITFE